jgi:hypothetical protein
MTAWLITGRFMPTSHHVQKQCQCSMQIICKKQPRYFCDHVLNSVKTILTVGRIHRHCLTVSSPFQHFGIALLRVPRRVENRGDALTFFPCVRFRSALRHCLHDHPSDRGVRQVLTMKSKCMMAAEQLTAERSGHPCGTTTTQTPGLGRARARGSRQGTTNS